MSGAASIPFMCLALMFQGSPRKWFAILAFVGLWTFCVTLMNKIYVAESKLRSNNEQTSPLEVGASSTFPVVGKDNFVWKDSMAISVSNQHLTR